MPDPRDRPPGGRHRAARRSPDVAAKPRRRWRRILAWTTAVIVVLVLGASGFAYAMYKHYDGRIHREDVLATDDPAIKHPEKQLKAQNFLLIGSDTRAGKNGKYESTKGQVGGERSDTTILAHLAPDGKQATLVSFPRDSWVHVPACKKRDGSMSEPYDGMFNSAFELGGAACTIKLVQSMTGIAIRHYVQIDFSGFKTMVEALGGVQVCSPDAVYDPESGLRLHAGTQTITGEQALAYVRARYALGDGSDLSRIERQQRFLGSMIRAASSKNILFNPGKLKSFLDASTKSVTLDTGTHLTDLYSLAKQLRNLNAKNTHFYTPPIANRDYTPPGYSGGGRVLLDAKASQALWDSIINDSKPVNPAAAPTNVQERPPAHSTHPVQSTVTVAPNQITVKVVNGVGTKNLATRTSEDLKSVGFSVDELLLEPQGATTSLVEYAPGHEAEAKTVAAAVPGSKLQADSEVLPQHIVLVVGSSYQGTKTVTVGHSPASSKSSGPPASNGTPLPSINGADTSCPS
ncbi:MAG TPA: LCP family protein [Mycobacteriales bacterium]|nr:LCP family protein [Mycobacteriales bacterium]